MGFNTYREAWQRYDDIRTELKRAKCELYAAPFFIDASSEELALMDACNKIMTKLATLALEAMKEKEVNGTNV